ncbi:hypothetical protein DDZ14_16250 [Maritimibacter sp. 55A14]|uniref:transposase domain-containing protein n=1 Tax=Maritimibacter sp. 55A14 TaxID=2174844 RepID=UPI000D616BAE|nr:transposase domain-containing protein [Maritimibacter sp. 55A14]PWE29991.1 hypothetical protein DDZ14_16250 [Maritimibacter sp. 55A14]
MSEWLSLAELLDLGHPSLPGSDRGLRKLAAEKWRADPGRYRVEAGGVHYHVSLLPGDVRAALAVKSAEEATDKTAANPVWAGFERLSKRAQAEARERLGAVEQIVALERTSTQAVAIERVSRIVGKSPSTLRNWRALVRGVPRPDWLAVLAPRRAGRSAVAACDSRAWDFLVADYLRPEQPAFTACFARLCEAAAEHGWAPIPAERTLRRRIEREIPRAARKLARSGRETAARIYPHQTRDRSHFAPLQAINADGHTFDVFVREPGREKPFRPVMVAIQDLYSGMIVGWRLGQSECWPLVRLAFLDMMKTHGIPEEAWLDNGRAFASKWMTGGQVNRFRFKVKPGEPEGLLTDVGVRVHWTTPYHGQAKPIERAFRDLCETIAKHPACAGAYTGNSPMAKPENYGSRAIPFAEFEALVAAEITRHNARPGRRAANCAGRSFAETYAQAAKDAIIARASESQLRLFALASDLVSAHRENGEVRLAGNRYWAPQLVEHAGRRLILRFDPQALHDGVAAYAVDGRFICEAELLEAGRFDDMEAARTHAKARRAYGRAIEEVLAVERRLDISDVAEMLPKGTPEAPRAQPAAVRLVAGGGTAQATAAWQGNEAFSRAIDMMDRGVLRMPDREDRGDEGP